MQQIAFMTTNRKIIKFTIDGSKVIYYDDIWKDGIQIYPKDNNLIKRLRFSRKPNLQFMAALIMDANSGKDKEEYDLCKNNEIKLVEFIVRDAKSKGLLKV